MRESSGRAKDGEHTYLIAIYQLLRLLTLRFGIDFPCKTLYFRSGAEGIRTPDLRRAKAALSQLSYGPGTRS
jgi:hypothetical protein